MSSIDIRKDNGPITSITVGDTKNDSFNNIVRLNRGSSRDGNYIVVVPETRAAACHAIRTKEEAENIIKGLQKAIELEWVK